MNRRYPVRTALALALLLPAAAQAVDTRELINKLAEAGRKRNTWVLPSDCQPEQHAVHAALNAYAPNNGQNPTAANGVDDPLVAALEHPWVYRYGGARQGELKTSADLQRDAMLADDEALEAERRGREQFQSLTFQAYQARLARLRACAYRSAAARVASNQSVPLPAPETPCAPEAVARANQAIQEIDRRLSAFLVSPAG